MIAELFVHPVQMGQNALWLVLPLCAVVAVVYKAVRVQHVRQLPLQVLGLWAYILAGLTALSVAFYMLLDYTK